MPSPSSSYSYLNIDEEMVYVGFFADFGPLNLGRVSAGAREARACTRTNVPDGRGFLWRVWEACTTPPSVRPHTMRGETARPAPGSRLSLFDCVPLVCVRAAGVPLLPTRQQLVG